jgi:hypothetical protein
MADGAISLDNQTLLQKADLALADLLTGGGLLVPTQAQRFIRILIDESRIMKMATVTPMKSPKQLIEKIRFGSRILHPGVEGTALPEADRAKPDLSKVELDAKEVKAEVHLNNHVLEDSIERDELRQTIMTMMGEAISRDLDELIVQGDSGSGDGYLAMFDGMLKAATTNIVNAGDVPANKGIWRDMLKTMPSPFMRNKAMMRIFTSVNAELDYRDSISDRNTNLGDDALRHAAPVGYSGIPLIDVPLFPEDQGGGFNNTSAILTDPKNLNVGIWRNIRFETDKNISRGVLIIVATMRVDFKFIEESAVVKATNIRVG